MKELDTSKQYYTGEALKQVILNSFDAIFVTDRVGNVMLCNSNAGKLLDINIEDIIGINVRKLIFKGIYDRSIALETIEKRAVVTGVIRNRHGTKLMCTGTPILDEDGEVILVIINVRDQEVVERYLEALEHERMKAVRYKAATEYLNEKNVEPYLVVMKNHKMREIIEKSAQIAKWDSTVMLFGESGTGKEVVAKYIHWYSPRAKEPFIPVNCAAVPSELMESEFFGYVSGAFTGASTKGKTGLFEIAHKGTLFLDEIGELPLIMQSKLLRVIETGEVQRLGSTSVFKTDVRLIAATNRDLQAMVAQKLFRHDLYYRLNVIPIFMPPLRDRPEDILALAETFLGEFNRKYGLKKELAPRAVQALMNYNWPGNVRELRNVIERLVVTTVSNYLDFEDDILISKKVPVAPSDDASSKAATPTYRGALKNVLKAYEEEYINRVLAECNGRMGEAAQKLGIHRTVLYRKKKAAL